MHDYFPETVDRQYRKSDLFGQIIATYIEETPIEQLSGDEFVLLSVLSECKRLKGAKTMKLVEKLFDCLEGLKQQAVFLAIVSLLISISHEIRNKSPDNYVVQLCAKHNNARYIEEMLVQLINKPNPKQIKKQLQFAIDIFRCPETKDSFFWINDLNVLLEVVVRDMDCAKTVELQGLYLELLEHILRCPQYLASKHKWEDGRAALLELSDNQDVNPNTITICKKIIAYMDEVNPPPAPPSYEPPQEEPPQDEPQPAPEEPSPADEAS